MKALCAFSAVAAFVVAGSVHADPVVLDELQLDAVTAGHYDTSPSTRDAVVVGDAADANVHANATVALDAEVQAAAKAVTVVNSASSSVANGNNVWDGHRAKNVGGGALNQANGIQQQGPDAAYVADFQLHGENRVIQKTETFDSEFTGRIIPQVFSITGTVKKDTTTTDENGSPSTTSTTSHPTETLNIGQGIAMAGAADLQAGGGGVTLFDHEHTTQTGSTTISFFWGLVSETTATEVTVDARFGDDTHPVVELMPFSTHFKGVACIVAVGSCAPDAGSYHSSAKTLETAVFPAHVQGANAAHIVLSDGKLQEDVESKVTLQHQAQRDLAALHVVNAVGSRVADALNVSNGAAATVSPRAMELRQNNLITQRR